MIKVHAVSVADLRSRNVPFDEAPTSLRAAMAQGAMKFVNATLVARRLAQLEAAKECARKPDIEERYAIDLEGFVPEGIVQVMIAALDAAGWIHTKYVGTHLIVARTEIPQNPGRGGPWASHPYGDRSPLPVVASHTCRSISEKN